MPVETRYAPDSLRCTQEGCRGHFDPATGAERGSKLTGWFWLAGEEDTSATHDHRVNAESDVLIRDLFNAEAVELVTLSHGGITVMRRHRDGHMSSFVITSTGLIVAGVRMP